MSTSTDFSRRIGGAFQFRLRTLLLTVTLCGAACALMHAIGPVWSVGCSFLLLLATLHVVGNAIGTRLRDDATANAAIEAADRPNCPPPLSIAAPAHSKRLAQRAPLGRWIGMLTVVGLAAGGTLGEILYSGRVTPAGVIVGTISSAVLGGFAAFLAGSFLRVGFSAAWQAHCGNPAAAPMHDISRS
jgi:hypothetical protein